MDSCNIKVAIKVRPLNCKELLDDRVYWKIESDSVIHIDPLTEKKNGEQFFFDRVFSDESTNYDVFDKIVKPIIDRGVQGFNGTVFAYGQTASGKTFTMYGDQSSPGIIPLAINYMFNAMNNSNNREYLLRACYLEIYNEKVIDLLEKKNKKTQTKKIEIQKDGLCITPLKAIVCQNSQMVIDLMKIGEKNRSIGETDMNERSSRSHTILRIILESRNVDDDCDGAYQQSVINLVDLAGSERSSQTQSSMERFKEGCKINSSLTTLGLVIQQLSESPDSSQHVNFRDSKLTRILQTSLGGNSLTAIICTVTLAVEDQTLNTLSFASRAKKIKNTAKVNENVTDETLLKLYRVQLSKLNKELEGIKQNQFENDEVNEIKYKYQEEKRTNEELKERIMRLKKNMITSVVHKDQPSDKKGYQRRRTWGGKLDNTLSSNSILETIEEDVNVHRPSVPSNFGNQNKEFKTPLEPFEWDLIREEDRTVVTESINNENTEHNFSPPSSLQFSVCETPKKVLRERVSNYKNMFEMSLKENNELREFTTLEKQMFYNNTEQLKDLNNLRTQVENLEVEKNESAKMIEQLKNSVKVIENEKRDIEVTIEVQKKKFDKRETELLATIQETREELKSKEDQIRKTMLSDDFMAEKQDEIKRLEMKIKEMYQLNNTYINEIETLKSQLLNKDQELNLESSKQCTLLNELSLLKNYADAVKSVPCAIKYLAEEGYVTFRKCEVMELDQLLEHIHNTVEQLQQENKSLIDENNNLKLTTNDFNIQMNNIKKENYELRSKLNSIEDNIMSTIKEFSGSSEINVDNSDTNSLIEFAVKHFEENANKVDILSNENLILKEKLSLSNTKLCEIKSFGFINLDCILKSISSLEAKSSTEIEKFKIQLYETIEENMFLKSSIQVFDRLSLECDDIIKNSNIIHLNEELSFCNAIKNEFLVQIEKLNEINANLNMVIENQTKVVKQTKDELDDKSIKLNYAYGKIDEMELKIKNDEIETNSNILILNQLNVELKTVKSDLEDKSNSVIELEEIKSDLLTKYNELEKCYKLNTKIIDEKEDIEKQLQNKLVTTTNGLITALEELNGMKIKLEFNDSEIEKLKNLLDLVKSELDDKLTLIKMENSKFEHTQNNELEEINQHNDSTTAIKLEKENASDTEIYNEFMIKSKELEVAVSQINVLQLTIEEMKLKTNSNASIVDTVNDSPDTIQLEMGEKTKLEDEFKDIKSDAFMCNHLETIYELNEVITKLKSELEEKLSNEEALNNEIQTVTLDNEKTDIEKQLQNKLVTTTNGLQDALEELNEMKIKLALNDSEIEKLKNLLDLVKSELDDKLTLIKMENSKFEHTQNNELEEINQHNDSTTAIKLEKENASDTEIYNEFMIKSKELEIAVSQINDLQLTIEEMKLKTNSNASIVDTVNDSPDTIQFEMGEKTKLEDKFKDIKSDATMCNHSETIYKLNEVITKLKSELEEKLSNEKALNNEFQIVTVELDDAVGKVNDVKSVINILNIKHESLTSIVQQLNYELKCIKSTLNEKNELIVELENTNLELSKKCKISDNQLNKIISDLKINLENKIKVENEMRGELKAKTTELEYIVIQENKVQAMIESMENELKSKVILIDQFKYELATKSNLISELENTNSELILKCDKINETMLNNIKNNDQYNTDIQNKLQLVIEEKTSDLNLINQKFMELSKHHHEIVNNLEDKVQQQVLNYHSLYTEFVSLSCDIESFLNCKIKTKSDFGEEILLKSIELDNLQKEYDTLEEEYMVRNRECDEAREKLINFESMLSRYKESEMVLRKEVESKGIALEEYKKNIEFLFSRNDSFQVRVNDFEDNVLVDLNEEFDLMKSEKANLERDLDKLHEKLHIVTKEMELSEERCEDLASIINVLVIEIQDANSVKQNLEACLNEAEYELIKSGDYCKDIKCELYNVQRELENACINAECVEKELQNLKCKFNDNIDKNDLDGCDVRNNLIDPLVDYVHDIKLKLTELNSAIISGNQSEKLFRTKVMSMKDDIVPVEETLKINCESERDSPDIGLEIDGLHKLLKENINLINTLQTSKNDMEKRMVELQCQIQKKSDENNKYVNDITRMENDLKEKTLLVSNLNDELDQVKLLNTELKEQINEPQQQIIKLLDTNEKLKSDITLIETNLKEKISVVSNLEHELKELQIQYTKLEEHSLANKEQVYYSYEIDAELRNGKRNIINEINLLEPGKIMGVPTDHNLSNLLDMFVSLIMTKEQQIVTDLVNDHNKIKQLYEDQIKQFQEDIKKGKEWQEQVESDNEKLGLELENLKSQKHNFPGRELKIKELTEKLLTAENQSFNYLSELNELKTQLSKTNELNYQSLLHEFEVFKTSSELSIQDMKNKYENLSKEYNETFSMYNDQKNNCFSLEDKIEKIQIEYACLKSVIEKKDEDIKNLLKGFQLKTNEYETLIEKYSLQKEEMKIDHEKKINELQLDLSDTKHNMYCTEKVLKEMNKNIEQLHEENSLHLLTIKQMQENNISAERVAELGQITEFNKTQIENLKELQEKSVAIGILEKKLNSKITEIRILENVKSTKIEKLETELKVKCTVIESLETELKVKTIKLKETEVQCSKQVNLLEASYLKKKEFEKQLESCYQTLKIKEDQIENYQMKLKMDDIGLIEVNDITEKLRKMLKCNGTLSTLYDNICSLMTKCENLEDEIKELKQSNVDLDNECESMLKAVKNNDDKITELLTQVDEQKENIVLLTEEKDFLRNKCEQFKNFNGDVKKLNEEICGYEQNIYELRKDKGQLIMQHDKELKQLKNELNEVQTKNMELLDDYSKLSETAKNLEKSLKEDIQQLNRCIVDKNAKISTLELFSKTNNDDLKKKNHELENVFKRARDENHMLRRELRRLKEITNVCTADQCTQTVEEQSLVSSAIVADHKSMIDKIAKYEQNNHIMKKMLHHRKTKIEELERQLNERHS